MRAGGRQDLTWNEVARKFHSPSSAPAAPTLDVLLVSQLRSHQPCFPPAAELPGPSSYAMSLLHCRCRDAVIACLVRQLSNICSTWHLSLPECCQVDILQRRTAGGMLTVCLCLSVFGGGCPKMLPEDAHATSIRASA